MQLEDKQETSEGILYSLETVESWIAIAENFMNTAEELKTGIILDTTNFENASEVEIQRATAEEKQFQPQEGYSASWYLKIAKNDKEHEWYPTAFIDARIASSRLETNEELNTRGWSDLVSYVEEELDEIDITNSAWAKLYRDYSRLSLQYSTENLDVAKLEEALIYARQAKLFDELGTEYSQLAEARFGRYNWIYEKITWISGGFLVVIVLFTFASRSLHKNFKK